eukprot:SAG25_NODE_12467_length_279_cov_2.866667_1_plen_26_part_10
MTQLCDSTVTQAEILTLRAENNTCGE